LEDRSVPTAYALTDLGNLGGPQSAQAYDINDVGQVVGYATSAAGPQRAFLWQDGGMTELGTLGGSASLANALNDAGQVVGTSRTTTGSSATNPFLWEGGVMTDLGVGPGTAYGINDAGQVVGQRNTHGFLWDDGAVTDIGDFGGGASTAVAINDAGQVVGAALGTEVGGVASPWRAFLWQDGVMTDLGVLPGTEESGASAVNGLGQVVGSSDRTDPETYEVTSYAFLYSGGVMTALPVPSTEAYAGDINDAGQVVGAMRAGGGWSNYHAYVYSGGVATNLNSLIPAGSGLHLISATGINNAGQIVGYAYDAAGHYHAFLLTPVPEGMPTISISDASVAEGHSGARTASFTLTLSSASTQPVTVAFATAGGTATAGGDYQAASGTVTFAPGETTRMVTVLVNGDRAGEPNETFVVNLGSPTNAAIADGQGVGTILDDEPRIRITDVARKEGHSGTTVFAFTVTLSAASVVPVTVNFATSDGAAKAGEDYDAKSGTATFAPGESSKTITVVVRGDRAVEGSEWFGVNLTGAAGAFILDGQGLGLILDDDRR
jgi:probable HAF family extracellular repeat protein